MWAFIIYLIYYSSRDAEVGKITKIQNRAIIRNCTRFCAQLHYYSYKIFKGVLKKFSPFR